MYTYLFSTLIPLDKINLYKHHEIQNNKVREGRKVSKQSSRYANGKSQLNVL